MTRTRATEDDCTAMTMMRLMFGSAHGSVNSTSVREAPGEIGEHSSASPGGLYDSTHGGINVLAQ